MAEEQPLINLKILSPSTEVKGDIILPDLPAATTIKELRRYIHDEIETRPATDRMRLIYRGRVIANETDTLVDVFGPENIRENKDQTIHLVLRELHPPSTSSSPAPRSSTAPPNPLRPAQVLPHANPATTNPFRAFTPPQPNPQPHTPHPHHHHPRPPQNAFGPIPIPAHFVQQQIAQAIAQNNAPRVPTPNQQSRGPSPAPPNAMPMPPGMVPGPANLPPGSTRTIRQETIGPNGERITVTSFNTSFTIPAHPYQQPILPRPFPHPPGFPVPTRGSPGPEGDDMDPLLTRVRAGLQAAGQEMENVRILHQGLDGQPSPSTGLPATGPPLWRVDRIRHHLRNLTRNLDRVQQGLASVIADPAMTQNQDVVTLQQSANELRGQAERLEANLGQRAAGESNATESGSTGQAAATDHIPSPGMAPLTGLPQPQQDSISPPADHSPEFFILSSPQGPVGILFNERRTYATAPMVSTLPFQAFTQQFAANRQLLAGLGQQTAQNTPQPQPQPQVHNLAAQPAIEEQRPAAAQAAGAQAVQNQLPPNPPRIQMAPEEDRFAIWAGHAWLIFKLACFMYIFAGGGGWYKPLMMGAVGVVVYLVQLGVFENQFEGIRRHFEALLPLADRQGQNQNRPGQNGNRQAQGQGQQPLRPDRNLTPGQAAQRLVQQHQEQSWVRQQVRSAERGLALFVASLWPGIGERMVRAQEERERAERAAEEEMQRQEEERRQQEEAQRAEQNQEITTSEPKTEPSAEMSSTAEVSLTAEASGSSGEGKKKVEIAEEELSAS